MIQSSYVTFEQAKLLKEKGFDNYCTSYYEKDKSLHQYVGNYNSEDQKEYMPHYSRPEHWQVVEWLRVKHGIWVYVSEDEGIYKVGNESWGWTINKTKNYGNGFNSPQEAYSAAFDYVLNNLI